MIEPSEPAPGLHDDGPDEGLSGVVGSVRQLAGEAKAFAEAELAYQKARAAYAAGSASSIAVRGLVAAVFAVFGLGALVIGLLIALATVIGPWLATIVVAGTLFVIALILALSAKARFTRAMAVVFPEDGADGAS